MAPSWRLLLVWACACVFLQLEPVDGAPPPDGTSDLKDESLCVFPFNYRGKTYYECTLRDSSFRWCSLTADYDGRWKYCTEKDHAACVFPFRYKGKMYSECTFINTHPLRLWCSVTSDYDKHRAWKFCDQ